MNQPHSHRNSRRAPSPLLSPPPTDRLTVCAQCGSELVQPQDCAPIDMRRWRVEVRCPECGCERTDLCTRTEVDRFEMQLDDAADAIARDLSRLERENMEEELARFRNALDADAILPEDF